MKPYWDNGVVQLHHGDCRDVLAQMPPESVHCVVTSPPYWGLRDYGLEPTVWGGDADHGHTFDGVNHHEHRAQGSHGKSRTTERFYGGDPSRQFNEDHQRHFTTMTCKCGAWLGTLGLEPTPELYVEHLVEIFREVRRVMRDDGTLWLNMGDSYVATQGGRQAAVGELPKDGAMRRTRRSPKERRDIDVGGWGKSQTGSSVVPAASSGLKPKDLLLMPARVALALQQPYHTGLIKNEVDRAWLAGLIDADGSIGIRRQEPHLMEGAKNPTFIPYLSLGMSDVIALERAKAITGVGKINLKHKAGSTDYRGINTRRDYYGWRLDGQVASKVIRDIYPYLVVKAVQAQLVYNMNLSLDRKRPGRWAGPVPPEVVRHRQHLYESVKRVNQREDVELPDLKPVDPSIEPGWWVRSDIIWSKPNPMPESVTDRPTRSHEYLFLLTKSERYYYDQEAVRESNSGTARGNRRLFRGHGTYTQGRSYDGQAVPNEIPGNDGRHSGRNKRTVWEIATQPFSDWTLRNDHQGRGAEGAGAGGKRRIASPDCPVHGDSPAQASNDGGDGHAAEGRQTRTERSETRRAQGHKGDFGSAQTPPGPPSEDDNSDLPLLAHGDAATPHNTGNRRTDLAPATSPAYTPSGRSPDRTVGTEDMLQGVVPDGNTPESNTSVPSHGESVPENEWSRLRKCRCSYKDSTMEVSHFATFPEALVEPCILAGCPRDGVVLDPFAGSGTVGVVAQKLGRRAVLIDASEDYLALAQARIEAVSLPMNLEANL